MPRMRFTYNLWGANAEDAAVRAEEHDHSAVFSSAAGRRLRRYHPEPTSTKKCRRGRYRSNMACRGGGGECTAWVGERGQYGQEAKAQTDE